MTPDEERQQALDAPSRASTAPAAIQLHGLSLSYRDREVVQRLSGRFEQGSLTAVVGPNGAGKTSLLSALGGALQPTGGRIDWADGLRRRLAWLPQHTAIEQGIPLMVADLVGLGAWAQIGVWKALGKLGEGRVAQALDEVGLAGQGRRLIGELSAGQLQRALFARVLMQDARLILLDEPFNAVDTRTTDDLLKVVARWHGEGRTVVAVLHDLEQARSHFPEALLMARQCIAWGPSSEVLTPVHLRAAYGIAAAWDDVGLTTQEAA